MERKHKDYLNQKLKFDRSILEFEKDFKRYNEILMKERRFKKILKKRKNNWPRRNLFLN